MSSLTEDLKILVNDLKEEESIAGSMGNDLHKNGLSQARVALEVVLEKHGVARSATIEQTEK
ncbi:hypothetical protein [Alteromonas macleodii]|uniref:Uncharacterized protein n=1 Tax=Alteromonas macleodii TaxID=28108 RepID=A0AB36FLP7_ALTMA|nr:hypothetical protein [Alteromonas macleodii]OES24689.1 hypothetical protein BFV93_4706 [Alteromonas macleodii]OES25792.1 hypothetical protein BFV94_4318 [Alteromonas macleodii]OES25873.1 hypothetical protein BFV95_4261 [Alteromonas macleodii]OES38973.1 hypothetical protein BFV96_4467 [Alteromonas macleodii]